jgi:hypothetical protein
VGRNVRPSPRPGSSPDAMGSPRVALQYRNDWGRALARVLPRALLLLIVPLSALSPAVAEAHKGSPHYRSTARLIQPPEPGLKVQVLNYDDRLQLINQTGRAVEVRGYGGEPYARLLPDGTVELNKRSPSYYLNEDRYGNITVPPEAKNDAPPEWQVLDKTGRFEWHDHRIHFMSKSLPNQVTDKKKRTKIFDWKVPIVVGGKPARIKGDLYWVPTAGGGLPRGALLALAVIVFSGIFYVEVVRRRRRRQQRAGPRGPKEAWG